MLIKVAETKFDSTETAQNGKDRTSPITQTSGLRMNEAANK
jgi:hypothetical protein